jgi:hypothetical protein
LTKVTIEIIALVILPFERLVLHAVLAELHGIDLGIGLQCDTHYPQHKEPPDFVHGYLCK